MIPFLKCLGDGIFDKMSNEDVVQTVWDSAKKKCKNLPQQSSRASEGVLDESLSRKTTDNVTAIMISLKGFQRALFPKEKSPQRDQNLLTTSKVAIESSHERNVYGTDRLPPRGRGANSSVE